MLQYRDNGKLSCKTCEKKKCGLRRKISEFVGFKGNKRAYLMIVGEAPGETEVKKRLPFVGKAGDKLGSLLSRAGIDWLEDAYTTNAVKCHPDGNKTPELEVIKQCNNILTQEIATVKPRIIFCMGKTAVTAVRVAAGYNDEISLFPNVINSVGNYVCVRIAGVSAKAYCFPHPSFLCRTPNAKLETQIVNFMKKFFKQEVTKNDFDGLIKARGENSKEASVLPKKKEDNSQLIKKAHAVLSLLLGKTITISSDTILPNLALQKVRIKVNSMVTDYVKIIFEQLSGSAVTICLNDLKSFDVTKTGIISMAFAGYGGEANLRIEVVK